MIVTLKEKNIIEYEWDEIGSILAVASFVTWIIAMIT